MEPRKPVTITRQFSDQYETIGQLVAEKDGKFFRCITLELPDKHNQSRISCIPAGVYKCIYTNSIHFSAEAGKPVSTYQLMNVPGRSGIRIHSANYARQLLGCVALGYAKSDIDSDGIIDVTQSRSAVHDFELFMNHEQFDIEIISPIAV